jgi:hypothetical protein
MNWKNFFSPAHKIAGSKALLWGVAGLAAAIVASRFSGMHANGPLTYVFSPRDEWWLLTIEYLIIWLIPAAIFYGMGVALSSSRIRPVDVLGTTAFALIPIAVTGLAHLLPAIRDILVVFEGPDIDMARVMGLVVQPVFLFYTFVLLAAMVLMLVWMFNAVRVSCNLRGGRLWTVYLAGLIGGDLVCKLILRAIS